MKQARKDPPATRQWQPANTVFQQLNELVQPIPPCHKQEEEKQANLGRADRVVVTEKGVQAPRGCGQSQDLPKQGKLLDGVVSREENDQEPPRIRAGSHPATCRSAKICQMIEQLLKVLVSPH